MAEYPKPAAFTNKAYQTYKFTVKAEGNSSGDFLFMRLAEIDASKGLLQQNDL